METITIIGQNYCGKFDNSRTACRAIIILNNEILMSYEKNTDQWMLPGGGMEDNESIEECCIREVKEETGKIINVSNCLLEIDEYYENYKYVSKYFIGEIIGEAKPNLTKRENEVGMVPRWIEVDKIIEIFSKYQDFALTDEMRRGMYLREFTALKNILK